LRNNPRNSVVNRNAIREKATLAANRADGHRNLRYIPSLKPLS
jgi:hypothetical protein